MLLLGNDIIDLNEAGIKGKSSNVRFVNRVFCEEEKAAISFSQNPDLTLWMFWAAKETAFKIVSKIAGPQVFSHKKFETVITEQISSKKFRGEVVYDRWLIQVKITADTKYIHAVGVESEADALQFYSKKQKVLQLRHSEIKDWQSRNRWAEQFTKKELESINFAESALIRFYCKKSIAKELKISPSRLQIIRPSKAGKPQPPFLLLDDKKTNIDISLSHHGMWLGYCFSIKKE